MDSDEKQDAGGGDNHTKEEDKEEEAHDDADHGVSGGDNDNDEIYTRRESKRARFNFAGAGGDGDDIDDDNDHSEHPNVDQDDQNDPDGQDEDVENDDGDGPDDDIRHLDDGVVIGVDDLGNEEDEEDDHDEDLLRRIIAAAQSQGIPLEYLASQFGFQIDDGDDEDVEYPFDQPPTCLADVAQFIQSPSCKRILVLAGAGMSVASGIPDFRSSDGLYATLNADVLTASEEQRERIAMDPSYSLDQRLFMENPLPCLEVNREFVLGVQERRWKATLAHRFVEMLRSRTKNVTSSTNEKSDGNEDRDTDGPRHQQHQNEPKLVRLYTQNIDGLEDQCTGMDPHRRRIAVHGSMDEAQCATCGAKMDFDVFCSKVKSQIKDITGRDPTAPAESSPIKCQSCDHPTVKPSIILFRSPLPPAFFESVPRDVEDIDLLIVIGTSLAVAPANSLVWKVPKSSMRVLINREPAGRMLGMDYESHDRDYFAQGDCEDVVLDLMEELGWIDSLRPLLDSNSFPESSAQLLRERLEDKAKEKDASKVNSLKPSYQGPASQNVSGNESNTVEEDSRAVLQNAGAPR
mmetsp:Transcript_11709/g.28058  ORF Transcript_11709/g.28058 Transcript_11709/m.28058 type:complete len:575 (+) Transcript_11709:132-1856(+)